MEATPLNLKRPEVPVELVALVAKVMAKEPKRRFQEPMEVARALAPFFKKRNLAFQSQAAEVSHADQSGSGWPMAGAVITLSRPATNDARPIAWEKRVAKPLPPKTEGEGKASSLPLPDPVTFPRQLPERRGWTWPRIVGAVVLGILPLAGIMVARRGDKKP
jgi:hypothetical protein